MVSGFNARKAAQVVAYLANKAPNGRLNILKAIKLVYLADRESLRQSGFPILDDDRFSMPHGPVNSTTLRLANGELEDRLGLVVHGHLAHPVGPGERLEVPGAQIGPRVIIPGHPAPHGPAHRSVDRSLGVDPGLNGAGPGVR